MASNDSEITPLDRDVQPSDSAAPPDPSPPPSSLSRLDQSLLGELNDLIALSHSYEIDDTFLALKGLREQLAELDFQHSFISNRPIYEGNVRFVLAYTLWRLGLGGVGVELEEAKKLVDRLREGDEKPARRLLSKVKRFEEMLAKEQAGEEEAHAEVPAPSAAQELPSTPEKDAKRPFTFDIFATPVSIEKKLKRRPPSSPILLTPTPRSPTGPSFAPIGSPQAHAPQRRRTDIQAGGTLSEEEGDLAMSEDEAEAAQLETSGLAPIKISVAAEYDQTTDLRLVGAISSLGEWNPLLGVPLEYNALEQRYCVELYSSDAMSTECKLVRYYIDGSVVWEREGRGNRVLTGTEDMDWEWEE
ncbi:hypothetical protein NBRC10512_005409 [Rhodotorula toruloides]|nr:Glycoside hydrolase, carbohydrate-binding domain containing protein [Rhodotorula toruloides NP11]EMS24635.1 Glycoside hydrolase, carbohydrate-binding domain containing protein [Rhodotorula toruloides NP11]